MQRFGGRTVVVTGAGGGIGRACMRRLSDEGALVVALDSRLEDIQRGIASMPHADRIVPLRLDVTDRQAVGATMDLIVARYGIPHGLVNVAGIRAVGGVRDIDADLWDAVMRINVGGTLNMSQFFVRAVEAEPAGRAIVNLSSAAGVRASANRVGYVASKHAVTGMTLSMALELGPRGIRVNAVAPGTIRTPFTEAALADALFLETVRSGIPLGREGLPEDVAAPIAFLLSDDAAYVNGAILAIDGGSTIGYGRIDQRR